MVKAGMNRIVTVVAVMIVFAMSTFTFLREILFFVCELPPRLLVKGDIIRKHPLKIAFVCEVFIIVLASRFSAQPALLIACAILLGFFSWCTRALDQSQRRPLEVQIGEAGFVQKWLCKNAKMELDGILIEHFLKISLLIVPIILSCFVRPIWTIWVVPLFLCLIRTITLLERVMHYDSHYGVFHLKPNAKPMTRWFFRTCHYASTYVIGPFFGYVPLSYDVAHVVSHHYENNGPDDIQTTLLYDRTSFFDYCRFTLMSLVTHFTLSDMAMYLKRKRKARIVLSCVVGYVFHYAVAGILLWTNPMAGVFYLCIPLAFFHYLPALVYYWHGFIDPLDPTNIYTNTNTIIYEGCAPSALSEGDLKAQPKDKGPVDLLSAYFEEGGALLSDYFGGGYHVEHHITAAGHWSLLKEKYEKDLGTYAKEGSIILKSMPLPLYLAGLFMKRFDVFVDYVVPMGPKMTTRSEIRRLLASRCVAPAARENVGKRLRSFETWCSRAFLLTAFGTDPFRHVLPAVDEDIAAS
jgi:hypothetical protein